LAANHRFARIMDEIGGQMEGWVIKLLLKKWLHPISFSF